MRHSRVVHVALLAMALLYAGCSRRTPPPAPVEPPPPVVQEAPPPPPPAEPAPTAAAPAPLTEDEIFARKTLEELNAERPLADVFFDFDQYTLRDEGRATLGRNAEWLRRWASTRVTIEGHADSRGTSEYNLALGDRRGQAVKDYLVNLGIAADRLLVVSKGEEDPVCTDEEETCWQRNRRGHFVITAK